MPTTKRAQPEAAAQRCDHTVAALQDKHAKDKDNDRQPRMGCRSRSGLLPCHGDVDSFRRRDEVIDAYGVLGNGELHALDAARKPVPP